MTKVLIPLETLTKGLGLIAQAFPGKERHIESLSKIFHRCQRGNEFESEGHFYETCREAILTCKYFPSIAEIISLAEKAKESKALTIWEALMSWACHNPTAESWQALLSTEEIDDRAVQVFRSVGGAFTLKSSSAIELIKLRQEFISQYCSRRDLFIPTKEPQPKVTIAESYELTEEQKAINRQLLADLKSRMSLP